MKILRIPIFMRKLRTKKDTVSGLEKGHVVHTLVAEHEMILCFLDELEKINGVIQRMEKYSALRKEFGKLSHIVEHLAAADAHHKREEKVLFPEMEKRGIVGPPGAMISEHAELKKIEKELECLIIRVAKIDFEEFKQKIGAATQFIVPILQTHIFKENNILYPIALKIIGDEKIWQVMKKECDKIGYCCFTPTP